MAATLPEAIYADFLVCKLCDGSFDMPKILPCQHTFCQGCLAKHVQRSTTTSANLWFLCPLCRNITDIPANGVCGFDTNQLLVNLRNIAQTISVESPVSGEKDTKNSNNCAIGGCASGVSQKSVTGSDICCGRQLAKRLPPLCDCRVQEVRFHCDTCARMLCGDCMKEFHTTHAICRLEERANRERDQLVSLIHTSKREVTELADSISDLDKYKKQLRNSRDEAVEQLKKQTTYLQNALHRLEKTMLHEIDDIFKAETDNASKVMHENSNVVNLLKNLGKFSEQVLRNASDSEVVVWRGHINQELRGILRGSRKVDASKLKTNPAQIRYKPKSNVTEKVVKHLLGEIQHGRNVDLVDFNRNCPVRRDTDNLIASLNHHPTLGPDERIIRSRVFQGKLLKSFSIFTDGSHFSPQAVDLTVCQNGNTLVVDRNNKCVKFFAPHGGMYKKIHGSESLWGVTLLPHGGVALTDKTVHIFDEKGRIDKVLRQQPRDSHGITTNSNGDVIVSDCTSRCVYVMSTLGGTIRRVITQRGRLPYKCPRYVTVNQNDDVIISDHGAHCVVIIGEKGRVIGQYGSPEAGSGLGQLDGPSGVCTDKLGNILVCDKNNHRVLLLDPCGSFMCYVVQGRENIEKPQAVAIDNQGNLVVAEEDGRVKVFQYRECL